VFFVSHACTKYPQLPVELLIQLIPQLLRLLFFCLFVFFFFFAIKLSTMEAPPTQGQQQAASGIYIDRISGESVILCAQYQFLMYEKGICCVVCTTCDVPLGERPFLRDNFAHSGASITSLAQAYAETISQHLRKSKAHLLSDINVQLLASAIQLHHRGQLSDFRQWESQSVAVCPVASLQVHNGFYCSCSCGGDSASTCTVATRSERAMKKHHRLFHAKEVFTLNACLVQRGFGNKKGYIRVNNEGKWVLLLPGM
jgi:hypothetical protein